MILSIAIPTFNRAELLDQSLRTLVPQCENRPVEICVSNNASGDETAQVLARYPSVRAVHQPVNIGIDRNTVAALEMGAGRYLLPIGDDELISPVGIGLIVSALRRKPHMLMLNGWHADRSHLPSELEGRSFTNPSAAFAALWDKMPLGSFVIRREAIACGHAARYLDTFHAYSGAAWDYLASLPSFRIDCMAHPVIDFREVPKSWRQESDRIHGDCIPRWFDLMPYAFGTAVERSRLRYLTGWGASRQYSPLAGLESHS